MENQDKHENRINKLENMWTTDMKEIWGWMQKVDTKLDNHLIHTAADISQIKNDIDWIKKFFWLVAGVSLTAIGGAFFSLILK